MAGNRLAGLLLAPLLLGIPPGCAEGGEERAPDPLIYEIAGADGSVEGWLVGTIHALPPGTRWRTAAVDKAVRDADLLVVEIAALDDRARTAQVFQQLGTTPALPSLAARVPASLFEPLAALLARGSLDAVSFNSTETWAAAIMLAQIDAVGDPANGVDRALIEVFADRPVRELEGAAAQLSIFDRLPEADQRAMLAAVVAEAERTRADPNRLQRAWLRGDAATIEAATREGILADPDVRAALLVDRNRRWATALAPLLEAPARPMVAVGAAHLVGPEGLAGLLEAGGYRVRRLR